MALERDVSETICSLEHNGCRVAATILKTTQAGTHKHTLRWGYEHTQFHHVSYIKLKTYLCLVEGRNVLLQLCDSQKWVLINVILSQIFSSSLPFSGSPALLSFLFFCSLACLSPPLLCFCAMQWKQDACDRPGGSSLSLGTTSVSACVCTCVCVCFSSYMCVCVSKIDGHSCQLNTSCSPSADLALTWKYFSTPWLKSSCLEPLQG